MESSGRSSGDEIDRDAVVDESGAGGPAAPRTISGAL